MNPRAWLIAAMLFSGAALSSQPVQVATPGEGSDRPKKDSVYDVLERARIALAAEQFVDAGKAVEQALRMPEFAEVDQPTQFRAFLFAAFAASGREDYLGAHEFISLATEFPHARFEHWALRAQFASRIENWPDAGNAIGVIAKRWPESVSNLDKDLLVTSVARMDRDNRHTAERIDVLTALFAAHYTADRNTEPSGFWMDIALDALAHNDLARAREILARITSPETLISMRIDKRFDALTQSDPAAFDVRATAAKELKRLRAEVSSNPRSLGALSQYLGELLRHGGFKEAISRADEAIARADRSSLTARPYDDLNEQLNWIYDFKYRALRAQGRWDEALAVLESGRMQRERGSGNVSQAINLGGFYVALGKPELALGALDAIDWAHSLSGYGRMQFQGVRYRAYLQLRNTDECEQILSYMRQHKDDAPNTWQRTLLRSGDLDGAAALYIERLHDSKDRSEALGQAQDYLEPHPLPKSPADLHTWSEMLARPDVKAAIEEVGRREHFPLYDL
jgi:tetratricopeptide (TPR) repeat protein